MNSDAEITFTVTSKTTLGPVDQSTLHHAWMSLFLHHSSLLEFFFYTLLNGILLPCDFSFFSAVSFVALTVGPQLTIAALFGTAPRS